jgi:hypothetical protein
MTQDDLNCMALILEDIANDLREGDLDEWGGLDDCVNATINIVKNDLCEYAANNEKVS